MARKMTVMTQKELEEFEDKYASARKVSLDSFFFNGKEISTSYAKYAIEYAKDKLNEK